MNAANSDLLYVRRAETFALLEPDVRERWMKFTSSGTTLFPGLLGLVVDDVRVDYCRMSLPFKPELLQAGGVVHGGAIASLLDAVLVPAVGAGLARGVSYSTVDLHVQFMRAVRDDDMVAEGWVTKRGRSVVFCESEAFAATTGRMVAKSVLTYNVAG